MPDTARHPHFDRLMAEAAPLPALPTAVVAPEEADALEGPLLGARHSLIDPILIGDPAKIAQAAEAAGLDIAGLRIVDEPDHALAARRGCMMVNEGEAQALMKGHLHSDVYLGAILKRDTGLRTGRPLSHVFVQDVPGLDRLLMITDAALNPAPDLRTKASIIENAIDLAHSLGVAEPKVAVLSATEKVNNDLQSTLDAAALAKMADRGQIKGGLVDGPLAMDNAINAEAAAIKKIVSPVAGRADILTVPNIETGNAVFKALTFLAGARTGGIVLGAKCPAILTSRADDEQARLFSCALAVLYARHHQA